MTIGEIFSKFPHKSQRLAQTMTNAGLHCSSCSAATWETLEAGMIGHGMNQAAIDKLVDQLNSILEEEIDLNTITLTPRAAKKFREFATEEGSENMRSVLAILRAVVADFNIFSIFQKKLRKEIPFSISEGIEIHIKKGMFGRLLGSVIDYVDGLQGAGFKISNPNVKSSCGCGTSQGY